MKKLLLSTTATILFSASLIAQSNVGIGTNDPKSKLDIDGSISLREGAALALVNGNNDNIALTGNYSFYRISGPTAAFSILGLVPPSGADGQMLTLVNTTSQVMTIKNNASGTPANSISTLTGGDFESIAGNSSITLQYNKTAQRWFVTANQNYKVSAANLVTKDIVPGTGSAVTVVNGANQVIGGGNVVLDVTTNALNQKGIVPGPTGLNANQAWVTDGSGNPAWAQLPNANLQNSSVTINTGTGLSGGGNVALGGTLNLVNTAPDQTVSITGAGINSVSGTYPNFTVTGTEVDGSVTNEAQTLAGSGTSDINLTQAGGAGGGTITLQGTGATTVSRSGNTFTINSTDNNSGGTVTAVTASNGLNSTGGNTPDIKLGGTLSTNTDVALNSQNLSFSGSGNVGIGTTGPGAVLDVNTSVNWYGGWRNNLRLTSTDYPSLRFFATTPNKTSMIGNNGDGSLWFSVNGTGDATGNFGMVILPNGNTGINNTNPSYKLDVGGTIRSVGGTIIAEGATPEGGNLALVNPTKTGATTLDWRLWNMTAGYGNGLAFWRYYANGNNAGPSVWFDDNGRVGIGTVNPGFSLHVPSGYIGTDYIYTTDNAVTSGVTGIMVKAGDNFHRTATAAAIATFLNATGTWIPNNGIGDWQIASSSTSTAYTAASLELRESNWTGNGSATPPHLGFHWGGVVASNIAIESSGRIAIRDNPGSGYENLIARETYTTGWFRNTAAGNGLYNEATGSGIYSPSANLMTLYNSSSLQVTSGSTSAGNIRFDAANPYITASSYYICPGGAYFNGGTVYAEADMKLRGGTSNDGGNFGGDLQVNDNLRISGVVPCIQGNCAPNNVIRHTPNLHLNSNAGYANIFNWDNGTTGNTSTVRVGNGGGADVFQIWANGNTGIGTGPTTISMLYAYQNQLTANGDGQGSIWAFRTRDNQNNGTGYGIYATNNAMIGYNYWGDIYTFGVHGASFGDFNRTGGVLGSVSGTSAWGSLGYKNSGSGFNGVYGSSGYASGGGFAQNNELQGTGGAFFGGMIGSWSRGEVMGTVSCGELFANYNLGNQYTSGYSADIVTVGEERMPAYNLTSTDLKVYADGEGALKGTSVFVPFESSYAKLLGAKPRVTVSPVGASANIYIKNVSREGFTVASDNAAQVGFSWIAVGKRTDATEQAKLPASIAGKDFDKNMKGVLFNENDKEHSATPIWWDGTEVRFDKAPEKDRSAEKAAEMARMETEQAKAKASAAEVTRLAKESVEKLKSDGAQEKAAAAMKANSVTHPEIHPVGPQGPPPVEKSISLEGENLQKK